MHADAQRHEQAPHLDKVTINASPDYLALPFILCQQLVVMQVQPLPQGLPMHWDVLCCPQQLQHSHESGHAHAQLRHSEVICYRWAKN